MNSVDLFFVKLRISTVFDFEGNFTIVNKLQININDSHRIINTNAAPEIDFRGTGSGGREIRSRLNFA